MEENTNDVYEVVSWLEERFRFGEFQIADFWLEHVDIIQLSDTAIIGALSMSKHAEHELTKRDGFLARAEPHLKKNLGEERTEKLLRNRR